MSTQIEAGWEIKSCTECGADAKFPAGLIGTLAHLSFVQDLVDRAGILCDECELKAREKSSEEASRLNTADLLKRSGAPVDDVPSVELHYAFRRFLDNQKRGLFVHGIPGTYKTSNAVELIREWCRDGKYAMYVRERQYFQACWDKERKTINRMKNIPLLVIDDLGTDHESQWSAGLFYDLVDARYVSGKKTAFISNFSLGHMAGTPDENGDPRPGFHHFDNRVFRRIAEMVEEQVEMT